MINLRNALPLLLLSGTPALAGAAPAPVAPAPPAQVRAVRAGMPSGAAFVPASVGAVERATISTRVAATVQAVRAQEGRRVARGEVLIALSDADLRGAAAAAETGLSAAAAHERRIQALLAERAATPAEAELAAAQQSQAEAAVAGAQANLGYSQLRAPFAGTVQSRRVEPGDLVGPGQPLLVLEGDGLELQASLSEAEARGLALGATVRFRSGTAEGTAQVTSLTPGGDPVSHRRGLKARVRGGGAALRSGDFARIEVLGEGKTSDRPWVPRSALVERGDLTGVFVAAGGKAELRWIAVGEGAGDGVVVRAGVKPGETVVDAPGALRDGQAVEVIP